MLTKKGNLPTGFPYQYYCINVGPADYYFLVGEMLIDFTIVCKDNRPPG